MMLHIGCELNALKTKMSEYHSLIASIILLFKSPIARPADFQFISWHLPRNGDANEEFATFARKFSGFKMTYN